MLKQIARKIPPIAALIAERDSLLSVAAAHRTLLEAHRTLLEACGIAPPGHFYSPIVSADEARRDEARIFQDRGAELPGIDLRLPEQLALLDKFEAMYPSIGFPEKKADGWRYFYDNPAYSYADAIFLQCMLRHLSPHRVIEVGSGYSTCAILDTDERFLGGRTGVTCIEPYPELLYSLISTGDAQRIDINRTRLQDVGLATFASLDENDVLFIDSTHVSKTGSDVNYLLFEILPALRDGVYIHIHDVFYPFEYPKEWIFGGRSWNEMYALRAFLQYNSKFSIVIMNTFLERRFEPRFEKHMPLCLKNRGGSIWLRKG